VFDVSWPQTARLVDVVPLDGENTMEGEHAVPRNIAPEGLAFVPADKSPLGDALLAVACEVSGTTVLFRVRERQ
jgi:hypothetical protein